MNMFSGIQQVDEHVKRLFNLSKNDDDIAVQCHTVAKLYFDINEYGIAKSYIERYLKAKSNSESGLLLKAKIHENLNDYNNALNTYETLFNVSNKKSYIIKACECLLNSEVSEQKAKFWIELMESEDPDAKLLIDLKIKFFGTLEASSKELENLEYKMKNDVNNQVKRQYLAILERVPITINVFTKCINLINSYSVLDDVNILKTCVKIFEKAAAYSNEILYKPIYCILLIALLKNRLKTSEYDCKLYLSTLYRLLKDANNDNAFKELKCQFLYHFVSFAHSLILKSMTVDISSCLHKGYVCLQSADKSMSDNGLSTHLLTWLNHQAIYRRSVANHMCNLKRDSPIVACSTKECSTTLANIIWPSKSENFKNMYELFDGMNSGSKVGIEKVIDWDIECHVGKKMDFQLIIWQLMNHLYDRNFNDSYDLNITVTAASFVNSLLNVIFPKLPMQSTHNRCPENICKADLITFLLGAVLTFKKSTTNVKHFLPLPFEYFVEHVRVVDTMEKWWQAVYDFLLNNKRNTSIGVVREFFKKGLEILQCIDGKLSESLKLLLGRSLAKFANESRIADYDSEVLLERSITFLYSTINENKTASVLRMVPITSFSSQTSLIRQNNLNSPFNKSQSIVLFDTETVPKEILEKWRFEAHLSYIDWKLNHDSLEDDCTLYDIHDLVDVAESMNNKSASLYLVKSRMYVALARKSIESNEPDRLNDYLSKAADCARRGQEYLTTLSKMDRDELDVLFTDQVLTIANLKCSENSLLNYTCNDESGNNIEFGETKMTDLSGLIDSSRLNNGMNNIRSESDIAFMDAFNENMHDTITECLDRVEDSSQQSQVHTQDITLLKLQSDHQSDMYSDLIVKFEALHRKYISFSTIENNCEHIVTENKVLKLQVEGLVNTVCDLEKKNLNLEMKLDRMQRSFLMQSKLDSLTQIVGSTLTAAQTKVQGHLQSFDDMESNIMNCLLNEQSRQGPTDLTTHKEEVKNETKKNTTAEIPVPVDLSSYTRNKWQCPTCYNSNDNTMDKCPSCYTVNPSIAPKTDIKSEKISFGSSQHQTVPNVDIEKKDNNGQIPSVIDLSIYTRNKWQCPTCYNGNDNTMDKCPSCDTANPVKNKSTVNISRSKPISFQKEVPKIIFGSNSNQSLGMNTEVKSFGFKFGVPEKVTEAPKILFGSNSNQNLLINNEADKSSDNFKFTPSIKPESVMSTDECDSWTCECTTRNTNDAVLCIACGEKRENNSDSDSDSDVVFVSEPYVTEEQKIRARALMLPDHFYFFENLPGYDSKSESEEDAMVDVESKDKIIEVPVGREEEVKKEDAEEGEYDPQYEPIVELPVVEVTTGDEGWICEFSERCKLYRFVDGKGWVERGLGDMKIMSRENEGKVSARVIMRREIVHRVCLSHAVQKLCPVFRPMEGGTGNSACWFANDFSESSEPTKENLAVRFKSNSQMDAFKMKIAELQRAMNEEGEENDVSVCDDRNGN